MILDCGFLILDLKEGKGRDRIFIPIIPTFHCSIIPCGLQKRKATKRTIIPRNCRVSETLIIYHFFDRVGQVHKIDLNFFANISYIVLSVVYPEA
jgi:hypothetical protein